MVRLPRRRLRSSWRRRLVRAKVVLPREDHSEETSNREQWGTTSASPTLVEMRTELDYLKSYVDSLLGDRSKNGLMRLSLLESAYRHATGLMNILDERLDALTAHPLERECEELKAHGRDLKFRSRLLLSQSGLMKARLRTEARRGREVGLPAWAKGWGVLTDHLGPRRPFKSFKGKGTLELAEDAQCEPAWSSSLKTRWENLHMYARLLTRNPPYTGVSQLRALRLVNGQTLQLVGALYGCLEDTLPAHPSKAELKILETIGSGPGFLVHYAWMARSRHGTLERRLREGEGYVRRLALQKARMRWKAGLPRWAMWWGYWVESFPDQWPSQEFLGFKRESTEDQAAGWGSWGPSSWWRRVWPLTWESSAAIAVQVISAPVVLLTIGMLAASLISGYIMVIIILLLRTLFWLLHRLWKVLGLLHSETSRPRGP